MGLIINARFLTQRLTGVQRYALECSMQIRNITKDIIFVAPDQILYPDLAEALNVTITGKLKGHLWEQTDLYQFARNQGCPPLLNLANTAPLRYPNNYITIHDLAFMHYPEWNSRAFATWYRFLVPRLARRSRHLFTVSNTVKNEICQAFEIPGEKISVTYNGIGSSFEKPGTGVGKKKQLLAVGTFNLRKNHHKLVEAFLKSGLQSTYELLIVGDKEDIYRQLSLPEHETGIKIINRPDDAMLMQLYREAEILVSLSAYEGFGLPVLEGLYYGCKVLCADIAVYRELFDNYVYFCNPSDSDSIIASLKLVTTTIENKVTGADTLFEKYSYARAARQILHTIQNQTLA